MRSKRIDEVHRDENERSQCERNALRIGFQNEKCFAEARQSERQPNSDDAPEGHIEVRHIPHSQGWSRDDILWLAVIDCPDDQEDRDDGRNGSDPEDRAHVVCEHEHEPDRQ